MNKIIIMIALGLSLMANEIQVFSTNTMQIELDSNSKITNIYNGSLEDFYKNSKAIIEGPKVTNAIINGMHSAAMTATTTGNIYNGTNVQVNQIISGGIGALVGLGIGYGVSWIVSDNEYISISVVVNSKGESTMIQSLIVANNSISEEEISDLGIKALNKLILKD